MDFSIGLDPETESKDTGSSTPALIPSVEGANLMVGDLMDEITFQYNASAASGSGSGSSSSSAFAYANNKLATGHQHTCAILDTSDLKCWGGNGRGQLGDGSNTHTWGNVPTTTIDLGTGRTAVAVSAGHQHTCAILDNGDLKCWGYDYYGQLGDGGSNTDTNAPSSTAIVLGTGRTAVAVSAGYDYTCAILDTGDLKCWGDNTYGQLGDGSNTNTNAPSSTAIDLGTNRTAVAVSVGYAHTCAILDNGDLKCWGSNGDRQTGYSSQSNIQAPRTDAVNLGSGRTVVAVSAGSAHTCAILDNGSAKCWGKSTYGQLGYPTGCNNGCYGFAVGPIDLGTGRTAVAVDTSAGFSDDHTCAILDNGEAKCWGHNGYGKLGNTSSSPPQMLPILVSGNNTWDSSTTASSGSGGGMTNVAGATCTVSPALPTGLSINGSTCTISGTPSVYAVNQTYTIYANQSGDTTTLDMYFSVDTDNAHTVVENQTIDPIGFHPPFNLSLIHI